MVGRLLSYCGGLFSGANLLLVSGECRSTFFGAVVGKIAVPSMCSINGPGTAGFVIKSHDTQSRQGA